MGHAWRFCPKLAKIEDMREDWSAKFAANLRALIESTGLSKKEVAESAGVDYKWLRRISTQGLKRKNERSADDLERLAAWFGVTDDELWTGDPERMVLDYSFAEEWPSDPAEFCERFKALCPLQYWLLVGIARTEENVRERVKTALSTAEPEAVADAWRRLSNRLSVVFEKPWEQARCDSSGVGLTYSHLVGGPKTSDKWNALFDEQKRAEQKSERRKKVGEELSRRFQRLRNRRTEE